MVSTEESIFSQKPRRPRRGVLERLYVYWLSSSVTLLLIVIISVVYTRGALDRRASRTHALEDRVADLERDVADLRTAVARAGALRPGTPLEKNAPPPAPSVPPISSTATQATTSPTEPPPVTENDIQRQLAQTVHTDPITPDDISDRAAATKLLDRVVRDAGRAQWRGATWARLAVVARLTGHTGAERVCVARARAVAADLRAYEEVAIREMLAFHRTNEALPAATELLEHSEGSPTARVLFAAAALASDDPGAAAETLAGFSDDAATTVYDRLLLARAYLSLEAWNRLAAALRPLRDVPADLSAEHSFLLAASLGRAGRTVEALAMLDALAGTSPTSAAAAWPAPGPSHYETEVWRGVTLALARKTDAARAVLQSAAELDAGRPEAQYQLGLLEARAGRAEIATAHLKNALAASERFAPAWEAWGALELDAGQIESALEHLDRAMAINPRRASAHFLAAIGYAKLSRETQTAEALRAAVRLDPHYLDQAKQTEVLLRLFTPAELDVLVATADSELPTSSPSQEPGQP